MTIWQRQDGRPDNEQPVESRERTRESLFLLADISLRNGQDTESVRIRNLSSGGMMVDSNMPCIRGETINVTLKNIGNVTGSIAWTSPGRFGIAFDTDIDPSMVKKRESAGEHSVPRHIRNQIQGRAPLGILKRP